MPHRRCSDRGDPAERDYEPVPKKPSRAVGEISNWVQGLDLNQRPSGYEPDELPGCSTLQQLGGRYLGGLDRAVNGFSGKNSTAVVSLLTERKTPPLVGVRPAHAKAQKSDLHPHVLGSVSAALVQGL